MYDTSHSVHVARGVLIDGVGNDMRQSNNGGLEPDVFCFLKRSTARVVEGVRVPSVARACQD